MTLYEMDFPVEFFNEALRPPNLKTFFSFALRYQQDMHQAQQCSFVLKLGWMGTNECESASSVRFLEQN